MLADRGSIFKTNLHSLTLAGIGGGGGGGDATPLGFSENNSNGLADRHETNLCYNLS